MIICDHPLIREELAVMAKAGAGDYVKGVVDVRRKMLALDADQHIQLKELLEENGSQAEDLWGILLFRSKLTR